MPAIVNHDRVRRRQRPAPRAHSSCLPPCCPTYSVRLSRIPTTYMRIPHSVPPVPFSPAPTSPPPRNARHKTGALPVEHTRAWPSATVVVVAVVVIIIRPVVRAKQRIGTASDCRPGTLRRRNSCRLAGAIIGVGVARAAAVIVVTIRVLGLDGKKVVKRRGWGGGFVVWEPRRPTMK